MLGQQNALLSVLLGGAVMTGGAFAQTTIIQSNTGVGCSSVCINGECTSTCDDTQSSAKEGNGKIIDKKHDFKDFRSVMSSDIDTTVTQGERFSVKVRADSNLIDDVAVENDNGELRIGLKDGQYRGATMQVEVVMPDLRTLTQRGAADLEFSGFDQSELQLIVTGAGGITGRDNMVTSLMVQSNGANTLDLMESELTNATVESQGTSQIMLRFGDNAGTISGHVDGVSELQYCGDPKNQVTVSGVAAVQRVSCS